METDKTDFFRQVWDVTALIPFGRVTSYGAIATYLGSPQSSRMVGWAMNKSHVSAINIPAHRVVNRNGLLTGKMHFGNPDWMEKLLNEEGIEVIDDQIVNFKNYFWDPNKELSLDF